MTNDRITLADDAAHIARAASHPLIRHLATTEGDRAITLLLDRMIRLIEDRALENDEKGDYLDMAIDRLNNQAGPLVMIHLRKAARDHIADAITDPDSY